ncbi:hypothetical protein D9M69_191960 [compost metagenome]|nr:hypothetical protein N184_25020 [Sinorhizobium sp. GL28]
MILIPPEFDSLGGEGSDASGLIASIKYALAAEAPFDIQNISFSMLGNIVLIDGLVDAPDADEFIRRVAQDIAGEGRILVRVSCPKGDPGGETH